MLKKYAHEKVINQRTGRCVRTSQKPEWCSTRQVKGMPRKKLIQAGRCIIDREKQQKQKKASLKIKLRTNVIGGKISSQTNEEFNQK